MTTINDTNVATPAPEHTTRTVTTMSRVSFTRWLHEQSHRNDPVGDLARRVSNDAAWPPCRTLTGLLAHLRTGQTTAGNAVERGLIHAWVEYTTAMRRPVQIPLSIARGSQSLRPMRRSMKKKLGGEAGPMKAYYKGGTPTWPTSPANPPSPVVLGAIAQIQRGYVPVQLKPKSKIPAGGDGWQKLTPTADDVVRWPAESNLGLHLGKSKLVDADLDSPWARQLAARFLPPSTMTWGRDGQVTHMAYAATHSPRAVKGKKYLGVLKTDDGKSEKPLLERRSGNCQTVIPPSVHPSGADITWFSDGAASEVDAAKLEQAFDHLAAACLLASIWTHGRHDLALAIAGMLAKAGADISLTIELVAAAEETTENPEVADRVRAVEDTYALCATNPRGVAGFRGLERIIPEHAADVAGKLTEWLGLGPGAASDKPTIIIDSATQPQEIVDRAFKYVLNGNVPPKTFTQGDILAMVRVDDNGIPRMQPMNNVTMQGLLMAEIEWYKMTAFGAIAITPPEYAVGQMLQRRGGWPGLPPLRGVVETPIVSQAGEIVLTPGYQEATKVWFHAAGCPVPEVSMAPTQAAIDAAVALLRDDILCDFPFKDDASRAHAIAMILLPFVRELVVGPTPLHLVDAPTPGTGKGLLADCAGTIATGRAVPKVTVPLNDEEMRKRITAQLLEGQPMIILDNLGTKLDSSSLAAVLTAVEWKDRILGFSKMSATTLPNRAVWVATGNNVTLSNEMARRSVWIRLATDLERPHERRGFRHAQLLRHVRATRGELIAACLTLAAGWLAAGRPQPPATVPAMGSYEEWREVVGGVLAVAGVPGFLGNSAELYEAADAEMQPWRDFVLAWAEKYKSQAVELRDLYQMANLEGLLTEALGDDRHTDRARQTRLGLALRRYKDRVIAGYRIEDAGKAGFSRRQLYRLSVSEGGGG